MKTVEELSSIKQQPHQQQHNEKNLCLMQTVECCDFSEMLKDVRGILKNSLSFQTVQTTNTSLDNLKTITSATLNKVRFSSGQPRVLIVWHNMINRS
jgi:hypothetical protein